MNLPRCSGILLHISSLPGRFGIGDLGPAAYHFADLLAEANQSVWQVLPLVPVGFGYSPYASPSTFAGNPLLISPDLLLEDGFLEPEDIASLSSFSTEKIDFQYVVHYKLGLLQRAYERFRQNDFLEEDFEAFCQKHAGWLDDYALFAVLKRVHNEKEWVEWNPDLAHRRPEALQHATETFSEQIRMHKFWQFLFDRQWRALKKYCNEKSIKIFGDLPIYVAHDSADVWANRELFFLDDDGRPTVVAGVPPDYFSETGQRWGNPIYRWDVMEANGFDWWTHRFAAILNQVDLVRLDHFRGFEAYWEVPASEETAVNGQWVKGPDTKLFEVLQSRLGALPVVAENLGVITPEVVEMMDTFRFPGMAVLEFAFDGDASSIFLPHNYPENLVAYTGTHDNDTVQGWWFADTSTLEASTIQHARTYARNYLNIYDGQEEEIHWAFNRALLASVARLAVIPLQDIIGLNSAGRMNTPGTVGDHNWAWRFTFDMLTDEMLGRLKELTRVYGRDGEGI